ncbi:MAG: dihydrofolate reductase [Leptolyngbyaceae cyanobacterium bins.59]|nr:dihydrofolate reductase [Leptolyngbyaceae cyanobacterium bins.59]
MPFPELILIAALAESNRVIGKQGKLPWHIPVDLQHFKHLTMGHTVLLGRKTWELDLQQRPLPGRHTLIVSASLAETCTTGTTNDRPWTLVIRNSLEAALAWASDQEKVFIAGGASLYAQTLHQVDRLELTIVEGQFTGDTFFPEYQSLMGTLFQRTQIESHPGYRFEMYQKISNQS